MTVRSMSWNGVEVELLDRGLCQREPNIQSRRYYKDHQNRLHYDARHGRRVCQTGESPPQCNRLRTSSTTENVKIEINGSDTIQARFLIACMVLPQTGWPKWWDLRPTFRSFLIAGNIIALQQNITNWLSIWFILYPILSCLFWHSPHSNDWW